MQINELSVFFPVYNEAANVEKTVIAAKKVLAKLAKKWEIIIVNDGSADNSGEIAKSLAAKDKRIRLINHQRNKGYGAALASGFYGARYDWIAFTDADGQFDFSEISKFIEKQRQTEADLVIGYYLKRSVSFYRIAGSKLWELAIWILFGLKVRDIDCAFKMINKKVIKGIPKLESQRGPFVSSELLIKSKKAGFKISQVGVSHFPRTAGKATGTNYKVIISGFADLLKLWKKLK